MLHGNGRRAAVAGAIDSQSKPETAKQSNSQNPKASGGHSLTKPTLICLPLQSVPVASQPGSPLGGICGRLVCWRQLVIVVVVGGVVQSVMLVSIDVVGVACARHNKRMCAYHVRVGVHSQTCTHTNMQKNPPTAVRNNHKAHHFKPHPARPHSLTCFRHACPARQLLVLCHLSSQSGRVDTQHVKHGGITPCQHHQHLLVFGVEGRVA